jgi:hypothetical protein
MNLHFMLVMIPCMLLTVHAEEEEDESKYLFSSFIGPSLFYVVK